MYIAVDFDGTVVESVFPDIGGEMPGALSVLKELQTAGHKIILWTCRSDKHLDAAEQWLSKQGFIPDAVNESVKMDWPKSFSYTRKVYADIYIDDRNLANKSTGINWQQIKQQVFELETNNKKGVVK
jgi:ribonucleotide monophosphatase NagD (HAD superfamily)